VVEAGVTDVVAVPRADHDRGHPHPECPKLRIVVDRRRLDMVVTSLRSTTQVREVDIGTVQTWFRIADSPKIGSGSDHPTEMANRIRSALHRVCGRQGDSDAQYPAGSAPRWIQRPLTRRARCVTEVPLVPPFPSPYADS
jgi:hypothetical protein